MTTQSLAVLALLLCACGSDPMEWPGTYAVHLECEGGACSLDGRLTLVAASNNPKVIFAAVGYGDLDEREGIRCDVGDTVDEPGAALFCLDGVPVNGGGFYATADTFLLQDGELMSGVEVTDSVGATMYGKVTLVRMP
jgi:hypothetical protein